VDDQALASQEILLATESTHIVTFWCHEAFLRHRSVGILLHGFGLIAEKFEAQKIRIRQNALALRSAPELRRSDRHTPKMRAKSLWAFIINKLVVNEKKF
jgi:hypothetical protein